MIGLLGASDTDDAIITMVCHTVEDVVSSLDVLMDEDVDPAYKVSFCIFCNLLLHVYKFHIIIFRNGYIYIYFFFNQGKNQN